MVTVSDFAALYPGAVPPLFGTPRSPERQTLGGGVFDVSKRMGKPLRAWQRYVADVALELEPDTGLLAYDTVVVVAMRQQGKTELMLPSIVHRCIAMPTVSARHRGASTPNTMPGGPDAQVVLYTAQTADSARLRWRDNHLARILRAPSVRQHMVNPADEYGGARMSKQAEALFWRNGSVYVPGATTGKTAGTGDTIDMSLIDEAWAHQTDRAALGMRPAMLTRPWRQLWSLSMLPGPTRLEGKPWGYLSNLLRVGRSRVEAGVRSGMAIFFWGADGDAYRAGDLDPYDPAVWRSCMPNLGHGIPESAVAGDAQLMELGDFLAEYLSIVGTNKREMWRVVSQSTWQGLMDAQSTMDGHPAIGIEISEDRRRAWIGAAGKRADGHYHVEVLEPGMLIPMDRMDVEWVLRCAVDIAKAQKAWAVVVDPRRPAGSLKPELERALKNTRTKVLTPAMNDIAGACGRFYDLTGQEASTEDTGVRLFHLGQDELDSAVSSALRLEIGAGSFTFVKKGSLFGLGPLYSVILAMQGFDVHGPTGRKKSEIW